MWNAGDLVWFSFETTVYDGEMIRVNEHSIDVAYSREIDGKPRQYISEISNDYPIFKTEAEAIQATIAKIQSEILQPLYDRLAQLSQPPLTEGKNLCPVPCQESQAIYSLHGWPVCGLCCEVGSEEIRLSTNQWSKS
jgi:hypothetical protein